MKGISALTKIVGHPDTHVWVKIDEFTPTDPVKLKSKGHLYILIVGRGNHQEEAEICSRLRHYYFTDNNPDTSQVIKGAINQTIADFMSQKLEIAVGAFVDGQVYLGVLGEISIYVSREGNFGQVLNGKNPNTAASVIKDKDIFAIATNNLIEKITLEKLKLNLSHFESGFELDPDMGILIINANLEEDPQLVPSPQAAISESLASLSPLKKGLVNLIDKALSVLPQRQVVVRQDLGEVIINKKRRTAITVGVILLILLFISIFFGIKQQSDKNSRSQYEGKLTQASHDFSEAKSLASLNPARARELILSAKSAVEEMEKDGVKDDNLTQLSGQIKTGLGEVAGIYSENSELFLDLSLISSGFKADQVALTEDRIVVLDKEGKKLVSINSGTKRTEIAAGPDIMPSSTQVTPYSDRNFVLSSDGIWEVGDKAELLIKNEWSGDVLVFAYSGNVYVVEKSSGVIWRYAGDGATFGKKQNWFGAGIKPDLSGVKKIIIDGSIWLLDGGNLLRFSQGSPVAFSLKGEDQEFAPADIFTNEDSQYLYLLDKDNGRVVVFDKNGEYKAQYLSDKLKESSGLVVSEKDKKIIFLVGEKLYSIELGHL